MISVRCACDHVIFMWCACDILSGEGEGCYTAICLMHTSYYKAGGALFFCFCFFFCVVRYVPHGFSKVGSTERIFS